jgi:Uma2 family endonuclease
MVGIDVVYVDSVVASRQLANANFIEGVPTLVVEILSPSDTNERVDEKIAEYLEAGVPLIWIANLTFRTITVYQPGAQPVLFNITQEITAEPHMPGFRAHVADFIVV